MSEKKYGKRPTKKNKDSKEAPSAAAKATADDVGQTKANKAAKSREPGQKSTATKPRGSTESFPVTEPSASTSSQFKSTDGKRNLSQQQRRNLPTNKKGPKGGSAST